MNSNPDVIVVGAGLAGSEACWQLVRRGFRVRLCEMRPKTMTKAHQTDLFAELVCSSSFRGAALSNAVGLLKEELRRAGSLIMEAAEASKVPAGGALAVDRVRFSEFIDQRLKQHPAVQVVREEVLEVPDTSEVPVLLATGPLTSAPLASSIRDLTGSEHLAFYDAISPIVLDRSLDKSKLFYQSRYDKGDGDDYLNIPLDREQYESFIEAVNLGEKHQAHAEVEAGSDVPELRPFEGCMPIEDMVERGPETLRFGPLKPKGLRDPSTGKEPHAVIQLRRDNREGTLWSFVGMQTRLKHPEQLRIFRSLPGLEQAEFVRLGTVHRNTFLNSPKCLRATLQFNKNPRLFFAGQITGVEGYVESTAGGLAAGINLARLLDGKEPLVFPESTAVGALLAYISDKERKDFQPMNISFGLIPRYAEQPKRGADRRRIGKKERREETSRQALEDLEQFLGGL